jgi:hypothetical protein
MVGPPGYTKHLGLGNDDGAPSLSEHAGLVPRIAGQLFAAVDAMRAAATGCEVTVKVQILEIYMVRPATARLLSCVGCSV